MTTMFQMSKEDYMEAISTGVERAILKSLMIGDMTDSIKFREEFMDNIKDGIGYHIEWPSEDDIKDIIAESAQRSL